MGLFSKLKNNFDHGGIKIELQAPASVSMKDASVPVTVIIKASDKQQTIASTMVRILAQSRDKAFSDPSNLNSTETAQAQQHVVAQSQDSQSFTIAPGEVKNVQLNIVMNAGAAVADQLPDGSGLKQVAGVLQKLQNASEAINGNSYEYFIEASAKIEGITFGPSTTQNIQVLKPGEFGTAIQKKINL